MFSLGGKISKGLTSFAANAVHTINDAVKSWTIGGSISAGSESKYGKLSLEGNYTISRQAVIEEGAIPENSKEFKLTLGYAVTDDGIARILGLKKGEKRTTSPIEIERSYYEEMKNQ